MAADPAIKLQMEKLDKPEQLTQFDCVLAEEGEPWHFRNADKIEQVNVNGKRVLSSPEMRLRAAEYGLGLCKLPDYVLNNYLLKKMIQGRVYND